MNSTNSGIGKTKRLDRILSNKSGRAVVVPLDDLLIAGPKTGLDLGALISTVSASDPDAILGFPGLFRQHLDPHNRVPLIVNLTASTTRSVHTRKSRVLTVETAVRLGADAVAAHLNLGSRYEPEMLEILGAIGEDCENFGMPLMAIAYPRGEGTNGDENHAELKSESPERYGELVTHAARIGVELGADIVKTQFTGDAESFSRVVAACEPVPVLVAGGPRTGAIEALAVAHCAVSSGGAGVSFGRNVFLRKSPGQMIRALRLVVHELIPPKEAMEEAKKEDVIP